MRISAQLAFSLLAEREYSLVTVHWTHIRGNGICAETFCSRKRRLEQCAARYGTLSTAMSPYLVLVSDVIMSHILMQLPADARD